ncbi:MAG: hypothetical protein M1837_001151 [Sclerophora amabilis]|nr:MAG: hypothetical protein M1837_001151 [Sclerophora amabilis]
MSAQKSTMPFPIPPRHSSRAALNERRLKHRESKNELKRKLSDTSILEEPERQIRMRIEEIELDREELELENEERDLDKEEQKIDTKLHFKTRQVTNKRIISLGDDLWKMKRQLRDYDEKAGRLATLTPDSGGAFASALLHLYKDPGSSKSRSSTMQTLMRRDTIKAYDANPRKEDNKSPGWLRCTMTGRFFQEQVLKAAHIVPSMLGVELADYIFGVGTGARLYSVDNCLLLHMDIEIALSNGTLVIVPVDPTENPIRRWKAVVTNDACRNQNAVNEDSCLGDLDGRELEFRTEQRPAARFLYYHFVMTLLRRRQYRQPGWERLWAEFSKTQPWPTPGRYLRQSMLLTLAGGVCDVNEAEVKKLVQDGTFDLPERLAKDEEEEVARRVHEVYEVREEQSGELAEEEEDSDDEEGSTTSWSSSQALASYLGTLEIFDSS